MADKAICSIPDCNKPIKCRGLCGGHVRRFWRYGDPLAGGTMFGEPRRFLNETVMSFDRDECLIWPFTKWDHGYGVIYIDGQRRSVHSVVCAHRNGPRPNGGYVAAHKCGNPGCCAPLHLRWATYAENSADRIIHGTNLSGEDAPWTKLTDDDVARLMAMKGVMSGPKVAAIFGVSRSYVTKMWSGVFRRGRKHLASQS